MGNRNRMKAYIFQRPFAMVRLHLCQEDDETKRMRVNGRASVTQPIPDMDTCLYRLHQSRPTNQTRIPLVRCTNRAGPLSTLLFFSLFLPLLYSHLLRLFQLLLYLLLRSYRRKNDPHCASSFLPTFLRTVSRLKFFNERTNCSRRK